MLIELLIQRLLHYDISIQLTHLVTFIISYLHDPLLRFKFQNTVLVDILDSPLL